MLKRLLKRIFPARLRQRIYSLLGRDPYKRLDASEAGQILARADALMAVMDNRINQLEMRVSELTRQIRELTESREQDQRRLSA